MLRIIRKKFVENSEKLVTLFGKLRKILFTEILKLLKMLGIFGKNFKENTGCFTINATQTLNVYLKNKFSFPHLATLDVWFNNIPKCDSSIS